MAGFGIEASGCFGRGFSSVDANGICAKFYSWVTKSYVNHGPNWYILDDFSTVTSKSFPASDVNVTGDYITVSGHGFAHNHNVSFTTTGTLPGGLSLATYYRVIYVDTNTIQVATNPETSYSGTAINLTNSGVGTHTIVPNEYFIVISDVQTPVVNDYNTSPVGYAPKFVKFGYINSSAANIRAQMFLWWDITRHKGHQVWCGYDLLTTDAGDFAYDFRGGGECLAVSTRNGTTWRSFIVDNLDISVNFCEDTTHIGTIISGVTVGTSVVLPLSSGEAYNFTTDKYYYLYDFNNQSKVNYVQVDAVNLSGDTITVDSVLDTFPSGAVIGSYPHRFYAYGYKSTNVVWYTCNSSDTAANIWTVPYVTIASHTYGPAFDMTNAGIATACYTDIFDNVFARLIPDDNNRYACQRPLIIDYYPPNEYSNTYANTCYGVPKNFYVMYKGTMQQMQDYRIIRGSGFIYNSSYTTPLAGGILHTESTS